MNFENLNIWCWIIPALVGIISAILGYLWGKSSSKTIDNSHELRLCHDKNAKLEVDLADCKRKLAAPAVTAPVTSFATPSAVVATIAFDGSTAKAVFGKTIKQDDLKVVEGIGPKIESMFKDADIKTWQKLSSIPVADCQKILDQGGPQYKIHDPASWPMQAKMCYEGKWAELLRWQNEHKAGKL